MSNQQNHISTPVRTSEVNPLPFLSIQSQASLSVTRSQIHIESGVGISYPKLSAIIGEHADRVEVSPDSKHAIQEAIALSTRLIQWEESSDGTYYSLSTLDASWTVVVKRAVDPSSLSTGSIVLCDGRLQRSLEPDFECGFVTLHMDHLADAFFNAIRHAQEVIKISLEQAKTSSAWSHSGESFTGENLVAEFQIANWAAPKVSSLKEFTSLFETMMKGDIPISVSFTPSEIDEMDSQMEPAHSTVNEITSLYSIPLLELIAASSRLKEWKFIPSSYDGHYNLGDKEGGSYVLWTEGETYPLIKVTSTSVAVFEKSQRQSYPYLLTDEVENAKVLFDHFSLPTYIGRDSKEEEDDPLDDLDISILTSSLHESEFKETTPDGEQPIVDFDDEKEKEKELPMKQQYECRICFEEDGRLKCLRPNPHFLVAEKPKETGNVQFLKSVEGRVLTIMEAAFSDKGQRDAIKTLIKKEFRREMNKVPRSNGIDVSNEEIDVSNEEIDE